MSMRQTAIGLVAFCTLVAGTAGCAGPKDDDNPSTLPDSGALGGADAGNANTDAWLPPASDAAWLGADSRVVSPPDSPVLVTDSATVLLSPDTAPVTGSDSQLATPDLGTSPNRDAWLPTPDASALSNPDSLGAQPDAAIDSAPDANTVPADAAVQFGKTVIFSNGRAVGAMIDWGWVAGGNSQIGGGNAETPLTTFTQPVCPAGAGALTGFSQSCNGIEWPTANALCMSGSIPAVTACSGGLATVATTGGPVIAQCEPNETMDWGENWGAIVGVAATPEKRSTIAFTPASIAATFTGSPTTTRVRLFIVINSVTYCTYGTGSSYISGSAVTAADFSNQCWTTGGSAPASLAGIQKVMLQIDSQTSPVEFSNFCFTGLVFE